MGTIEINNTDFWVKVVEMLQQNWALIDDSGEVTIYFMSDDGQVFDTMAFTDRNEAETALRRNGFGLLSEESPSAPLRAPEKPFTWGSHPNGKIYSSGRYWS